jgi:integrase
VLRSEQNVIDPSNQAYQNFINSLKSQSTRDTYARVFKKYLRDNNVTIKTLLKLPVKDSEQLLINAIEKIKADDKSHSSGNLLLATIKHFYVMNDIRINERKLGKFLGESGRKNTDRGYTHEEIRRILDVADLRMKSIFLLMASSGMRIGAIPDLKLEELEEIPNEKIYKIIVYRKSKQEYYTFCSHECISVLNTYLDYRKKSGEILDDESYLIREQFDINDFEQIRKKSRKISLSTLEGNIQLLLRKAGLRDIDPNFQHGDRTPIPMSHGFRKFWMTEAVKSKMPHEQREMLLGHKIQLASAYYRPSQEDLLDAYLIAVDNLTINEENRLKKKVTELQIKYDKIDQLVARINLLEKEAGINKIK